MKKYESVLFDLDGTLTDSGEGITKSAVFAFEKLRLTVPSQKDLELFIGPPLAEIFPKYGVPVEQTDEAIRYFRQRYKSVGKFENKPYDGIEKLLKDLKKAGMHLYVATSKPETTAVEILSHFHLDSYFDEIAGATESHDRETKDAVIAYLLNHVHARNCVMVGDTRFDVLGAAKLHIPCIGVAWGYGSCQEMKEAGAVAIVSDIKELEEKLLGK